MKPHRERWRFRFILASSFAAPLLSILRCRIFCVYNWGGSLSGKTATLKAALSVWGDPDNLMCTYNGTDNAIEAYCATFNDLPVGIDERQISGATDKSLSSLIYKLCEGTGRKRLNKDSSLRAAKTWRNVFLTTGEEPIISDRTMTGVSNRIIEIVGGPFDSKEQGAEMHRICAENCGWAGPAFLETVRDEIQRAMVREEYGEFQRLIADQSPDSNPNHIACIAAVAVADFRVSQLFFGESEAEAREHALSMCKSVLGNIRENLPDDVNKNAVRYLASWIGIHRANFGTECKGPCYGYTENNIAYLYPSAFQMAMDEGHYSTRKVRKYMAENGMMQYTMEGNKKLYSIVQWKNGRAERYVGINLDKLTDPAEASGLVLEDEVGQEELPFT